MKHAFLAILAALSVAAAANKTSLADLPDPLVGTDSKYELSRGNTYPGVFLPFGMIGWTAQTGDGGWPYQYFKDSLIGFRATHRPSAWMDDYGAFSFMPVVGELKVLSKDRAAKFQHSKEEARAYRYGVTFENGAGAEMTSGLRSGMFRFTYPAGEKPWLVVDANDGGGAVEIDPAKQTVSGKNSHIRTKYPENFAQYFVAVFDHPFVEQGTWDDTGARDDAKTRAGKHVGAFVRFANGATVTMRVGVSLISVEQARRNLDSELRDFQFDKAVARARATWENALSQVRVAGGTEAQRGTFYTAMYHALQLPRIMHEVDANGKTQHYSAFDGQVHEGVMYADTGFWDTFRAAFPLLTILQPKRDAEIIRAMLNASDEGGWIPKWPNPGYTNVMIGTHGDSVIADAYVKGIRDFDLEKAYAALRKDATTAAAPGSRYHARDGIEDYLKLGYVPADKVKESAACTLEYAYDDFCVAQMARGMGRDADYKMFVEHSKKYRNLWDPSVGFMRGRNSDGSWVTPFDPLAWGGVYTEGNAWQWLWSVQHDIPGLIALMGGKEKFTAKLDELFSTTTDFKVGGYGQVIHEMTEAKMANTGQYAHINEPVHHVIYCYSYVGQQWKVQQWVRTIMDKFYLPGPAGWLGDEDTGQMSSWYIFNALGFYPVNPGQADYALGTPLFDNAQVKLENGKTFTVNAKRTKASDIYVQAVWLNGKTLERPWITHAEIMAGGELTFELGPEPNKSWGAVGMRAAE